MYSVQGIKCVFWTGFMTDFQLLNLIKTFIIAFLSGWTCMFLVDREKGFHAHTLLTHQMLFWFSHGCRRCSTEIFHILHIYIFLRQSFVTCHMTSCGYERGANVLLKDSTYMLFSFLYSVEHVFAPSLAFVSCRSFYSAMNQVRKRDREEKADPWIFGSALSQIVSSLEERKDILRARFNWFVDMFMAYGIVRQKFLLPTMARIRVSSACNRGWMRQHFAANAGIDRRHAVYPAPPPHSFSQFLSNVYLFGRTFSNDLLYSFGSVHQNDCLCRSTRTPNPV